MSDLKSNLKAKTDSLATAIAGMRSDVPAIEWRTGQLLSKLAELTEIVAELAGGGSGDGAVQLVSSDREMHKAATRREASVKHLLWLACKQLPKGTEGEERDREVRRVMLAWGVKDHELAALGYGV